MAEKEVGDRGRHVGCTIERNTTVCLCNGFINESERDSLQVIFKEKELQL